MIFTIRGCSYYVNDKKIFGQIWITEYWDFWNDYVTQSVPGRRGSSIAWGRPNKMVLYDNHKPGTCKACGAMVLIKNEQLVYEKGGLHRCFDEPLMAKSVTIIGKDYKPTNDTSIPWEA